MIDNFDGEYAFLSNFYESPMTIQGITYPTNEHFFQAMKTLDLSERKKIASAQTLRTASKIALGLGKCKRRCHAYWITL